MRGRQPTASRRAVIIRPTGRKVNRDSSGNIQQAAPTGRIISTRQNTSTRGAAALPAAAAAQISSSAQTSSPSSAPQATVTMAAQGSSRRKVCQKRFHGRGSAPRTQRATAS